MIWQADGQLIVFGGTPDGQKILSSVEILERPTQLSRKDQVGNWRVIAPMMHARYGHSAAEFNGNVFAVGGLNSDDFVTFTEAFAPPKAGSKEMGQWTIIAEMSKPFEVSFIVTSGKDLLAFCKSTLFFIVDGYCTQDMS